MANPNQVIGQARIRVDGEVLETDGSSTLDLGGPVREAVTGDYSAGAFKEMTAPSKLECTVLTKGRTSLAAMRAISDATISIEYDNGQSYLINHGYLMEAITITQSDGKAKLVFGGPAAEQVA